MTGKGHCIKFLLLKKSYNLFFFICSNFLHLNSLSEPQENATATYVAVRFYVNANAEAAEEGIMSREGAIIVLRH